MIECNIKLITLLLDEKTNNYKTLSTDKDRFIPITIDLKSGLDISVYLEQILEQYIKTEQPIHPFKIIDASLSEILDIYYIVFITYKTTIKHGFLQDLNSLMISDLPNNAKKIISLL